MAAHQPTQREPADTELLGHAIPLEAPYDQALREIPGARSYRVLKVPRARRVDGRLELRTDAGRCAFSYQVFRSHVDHQLTIS
jgi:hypothetical protein